MSSNSFEIDELKLVNIFLTAPDQIQELLNIFNSFKN